MLKFSGCSCLTSGRKPKGVLHNAKWEALRATKACNRQRSPTKSELASPRKESSSQSVNIFQLNGNLIGKPDGQIQSASPMHLNRKLD